MLTIGQKVAEWSGPALVDGEIRTLSSSDLSGRWYVLYWYPLDFTDVCPTEIREFERLRPELELDDVALIGVSTDSVFSHRAWFADREVFPAGVGHPVLGDTNHSVSRAFGVLDEESGTAFRATAVVDHEGRLRSLSVNDVQVGRSPSEVLRTVHALLSGGMCGADWRRGDRFAA
jgi:peroxiredoxin (alkyl hydroperoxide reductase subunit C)